MESEVARPGHDRKLLGAGMAGVIVILLGFTVGLLRVGSDGATSPPTGGVVPVPSTMPTSTPSGEIRFTIVNQLGEGETSRIVTLAFSGRAVGKLTVDTTSPIEDLQLVVDDPGELAYEIQVVFSYGETNGVEDRGQANSVGIIDVRDGDVYIVDVAPHAGSFEASLREL